MAKTVIEIDVNQRVAEQILIGRHPHTPVWNEPGYLDRKEWNDLGQELMGVVTEIARDNIGAALESRDKAEALTKETEGKLVELQLKHDSVLTGIERLENEKNTAEHKVLVMTTELDTANGTIKMLREDLVSLKASLEPKVG